MQTTTYPQSAFAFDEGENKLITVALQLDNLSLNYRIEFQPDTAAAFVCCANAHNVTACDLVMLIDSINAAIPRMQFAPGNSNNGRPHHKFLIGNEYSRVIYVQIAKAYLPVDFDYNALTARLKSLANTAQADESTVEENDSDGFTFRFWWD